jgi:hypothetical protein
MRAERGLWRAVRWPLLPVGLVWLAVAVVVHVVRRQGANSSE